MSDGPCPSTAVPLDGSVSFQKCDDLGHGAGGDGCGRWRGRIDHDHRNTLPPRRDQLGGGSGAAAVPGHQGGDVVLAHHVQLAVDRVGTTVQYDDVPCRQRSRRGVHQTDEIGVPIIARIGGQIHPAGRQENMAFVRQEIDFPHGASGVGHACPPIPGLRGPFRPAQREEPHPGGLGRANGVRGDGVGKRMRRVDDDVDRLGAQIPHQPVDPAEAANANLARRQRRSTDPAGE